MHHWHTETYLTHWTGWPKCYDASTRLTCLMACFDKALGLRVVRAPKRVCVLKEICNNIDDAGCENLLPYPIVRPRETLRCIGTHLQPDTWPTFLLNCLASFLKSVLQSQADLTYRQPLTPAITSVPSGTLGCVLRHRRQTIYLVADLRRWRKCCCF